VDACVCKYLFFILFVHIHIHTVLDMWMLASADDLVITPSSTYGMMGAALNPARASPEFARSGRSSKAALLLYFRLS
jgi:hypothetical protein